MVLLMFAMACLGFFDPSELEIMALQEKGRIQNTMIVDYPNFTGNR